MRRQNVFGFVAVTAVALLLGHGIAAAQAQTGTPVPDANTGLTRQVNLTPAEELAQSEGSLARMDASRTGVQRMLETSRVQRDVVKVLCLNDKLNQVDVAVRSARERRQALEAAVARNDADLANHEFTILTVLRQRTDQLTAEANQCIGQEAAFQSDNAVTSTVDPNLPQEDPWQSPTTNVIVEPPACSSCIK